MGVHPRGFSQRPTSLQFTFDRVTMGCFGGGEPQGSPATDNNAAFPSRGWCFFNRRAVTIFFMLGVVGGIALGVVGIVLLTSPTMQTTVVDAYASYLSQYNAQEVPILQGASLSLREYSLTTLTVPFTFVEAASKAVIKSDSYADVLWLSTIDRPSSGSMLRGPSLTVTAVYKGRTIVSNPVTLPDVPLVNNGQALHTVCYVIERQDDVTFSLSKDFVSCFYPFDRVTANQYRPGASGNVTTLIRASYDPYIRFLETYGKGNLAAVENVKLLTSALPLQLLVVGIVIAAVSSVSLFVMWCCLLRSYHPAPAPAAVGPQPPSQYIGQV